MASYPGSIFNPTPIQSGDTGQPAQVNDAYSELTAIETALITGPIQLPNSSLTALSVTGGSTFHGAIVVQGPLSVGSSGSIALPRIPTCKVTHSAVQEIPNNSFTGLSWDTNLINSTAMHSTSANSSRIVLTSSGLWVIGVQTAWLGNATPSHETRVHVNDDYVLAQVSDAAFALDPFVHGATGLLEVTNTTTYVTVQVRNTGSTGRVNAYSTGASPASPGPAFWAYKVSV